MSDKKDRGLPKIDTNDFELALCDSELRRFHRNRPAFIKLLYRLIDELQLQDRIEHLTIRSPAQRRAVLYRDSENPWPSKQLCLDIYTDRYMDERLLRHELGHERDRRDSKMLYDPTIEKRWKDKGAFQDAANISLDARLGKGGIGKKWRREEFRRTYGEEHTWFFEEAWANPPATWPEIEALAKGLLQLEGEQDK